MKANSGVALRPAVAAAYLMYASRRKAGAP
jgi:hypothetical protein